MSGPGGRTESEAEDEAEAEDEVEEMDESEEVDARRGPTPKRFLGIGAIPSPPPS